MSKVALIPCDDYSSPDSAVSEAIALAGGFSVQPQRGARITVKPNLLTASRPEDAVVTHPSFIAAVTKHLNQTGLIARIAESPAWGSARGVCRSAGYEAALKGTFHEISEFDSGTLLSCPTDLGLKEVTLADHALNTPLLINAPKLKGHVQMIFTGAVKNLFGCVVGKRKPLYHCMVKNSKVTFAHMLLDIVDLLPPTFAIMDAIMCMEGNGPSSGTPRKMGGIIASREPLHADVLACHLIGLDPEQSPLMVAAKERGLPYKIDDIEIVGADPSAFRLSDFERAEPMDITFNPLRVAMSAVKGQLIKMAEK